MKFTTIILINLLILSLGIIMVSFGLYFEINQSGNILRISLGTIQNILISVGCSLIATSIITAITTYYLNDDKQARRVIDIWGLKNIEIRSTLNIEINERLDTMTEGMDIVALGMKNLLAAKGSLIRNKINQGVNVRILTLNPESNFVKQREKEEDEPEGQIKKSINSLIEWAKEVKQGDPRGQIVVKIYDGLPQDTYQRIDKYVYVGPLHYAKPSQQTISYEYKPNSKGASYYTEYFTSLWENEQFCKIIV